MQPNEYDKEIQRYDKLLRPLVIFIAIYILVGVTIGARQVFVVGHKIDNNVQQTQTIINNNQAGTLQARKDNIQRQKDLNGYIKCLVLLRYDRPDITPASSRQDTESALDNCAKSTAE